MLLVAALVLLSAWLLAVLFSAHEGAHVLLLVGLMLLMIAGLKARDAAIRPELRSESEKR